MSHVVFVTSEEVVEFDERRGNCENYIKEAKYDMSVGQRIKKVMQNGVNYAKVKRVSPQPSSIWGENGGKKYSTFLVILKQVDCSLQGATVQTATLTPIITAIISLVVILISAYVSRLTLIAASQKLEKQQLGSMTDKLYDVRIESYPKGMQITEALRKSQLTGDVTLTENYLNEIVSRLDLWYSSKAGFVLSRHSAQCFAELHKAIRVKPESNGTYSPEQIDRMVRARREFRMALRADILLLFNEDVILTEDFLED